MCIADAAHLTAPGWAEVEEQRLEALAHTARVLARLRPELVAYVGPVDRQAGAFCGTLGNRVIPYRALVGLVNPRGRPVLTDAGGHLCRFSFALVGRGLARTADLALATEADLEAAARAAEQLRRGGGDEGLE